MKMYIEIKDENDNIITSEVIRSRLVEFVDPNKYYDVPYTIKQDGKKVYEKSRLLGRDLTENQIAILFVNKLL